MKKKAINIALSTAVAASVVVPVQQVNAVTNINQLITDAQNAGTVLKWAISVEGSADFKTRPYNTYNTAKKAIEAAETAATKLSASEKLGVQAKLVEPKTHVQRAQAYIDAITSSEKIISLTNNLNKAIDSADLGKVETTYHTATAEYRKQAKLLDRVYGQSTRDGIRSAVKPTIEKLIEKVKYDVTVKVYLDKAADLIEEDKLLEAASELEKAHYYLTLKGEEFTFKTQLEKSYAGILSSLPLQPLSASSDGQNKITINFSKEYNIPLENLGAGQFKVSGETIQTATLSADKKSVILTTSNINSNTKYTVTWKDHTVNFTTAAVADTSGITISETDVAYIEASNSRTYTAKLTNTDGTPYIGRVKINLAEATTATEATSTTAVITAANGPAVNACEEWTAITDINGNLVFTIAAAYNSNEQTASVLNIQPTIQKLDGDQKSKKASVTYFLQLQNVNNSYTLSIDRTPVNIANDYVFANDFKYKWDANDQFFIRGQKVSQAAFKAALSIGDTVTVDYKTKSINASSWNITVDVTSAAKLQFLNPAHSPITFDGFTYDISGTAQPGNLVKVYRNELLVSTSTADANGNWTLGVVNLIQNTANTFVAYQYTPGKDGDNGASSENPTTPATTTINEGAFTYTELAINDKDDDGLTISDTLDFTFLNASYGHEFKKALTGTITFKDSQGKSAEVKVDYVDSNTLKVVDLISMESDFDNSEFLTVKAISWLVNQDQLSLQINKTP